MSPIQIEQVTLDNGLRVNLAPDPSTPIVAVNLWYGVGSRNERPGKTGFAHLFEHMMFEGSLNIPKGLHWELVERAGGSMNASTWFDRTNYFSRPAELIIGKHCLAVFGDFMIRGILFQEPSKLK